MSSITKEWLQKAISQNESMRDEIPFGWDEDDINMLAAMKLALASLEAEASGRNPVLAYADSYRDMANQGVESIPVWSVITDLERNIAPLFTAPPAPISVPAAMEMDDDFDSSFEHGKAVGWNACRAAMLQGAEPVSNRDELPLDYLQGQKDGLEWAAQLAEANHPQTGDWIYDDPIELAKAIRKGPDMPETAGNSPVIPDCWVMVPVEPTEEMCDVGHVGVDVLTGVTDENEYYSIYGKYAAKVYRAMIAAAPKQEVK